MEQEPGQINATDKALEQLSSRITTLDNTMLKNIEQQRAKIDNISRDVELQQIEAQIRIDDLMLQNTREQSRSVSLQEQLRDSANRIAEGKEIMLECSQQIDDLLMSGQNATAELVKLQGELLVSQKQIDLQNTELVKKDKEVQAQIARSVSAYDRVIAMEMEREELRSSLSYTNDLIQRLEQDCLRVQEAIDNSVLAIQDARLRKKAVQGEIYQAKSDASLKEMQLRAALSLIRTLQEELDALNAPSQMECQIMAQLVEGAAACQQEVQQEKAIQTGPVCRPAVASSVCGCYAEPPPPRSAPRQRRSSQFSSQDLLRLAQGTLEQVKQRVI